MKNILVILLVFGLFCCRQPGKLENNLEYAGNVLFDKQITDTLFNAIRDYPLHSEFAIALIVGDTTEYYGVKRNYSEVVSVSNKESIFEIGSISKVFLTSLLVQALQDSLVTLNSYIRDVVPFEMSSYGFANNEVQVIHLANHTSGIEALPNGIIKDYQYDDKDDDEFTKVKSYLKVNTKFKWAPGTKYEYSNLGMALLGRIIEDLYSQSYEDLLAKHITKPLSMYNTCVNLNAEQKKNLLTGLDQFGKKAPMLVSGLYACSGGLKSNVIDLVKFVKANMNDGYKYKLAHETTIEQDEVYGAGLGWSYSKRSNSRVYFHHGGTMGYCSGIAFDKKNKIGIVLLTNRSALLKNVPVVTDLMYSIFGETFYKFRKQNKSRRN